MNYSIMIRVNSKRGWEPFTGTFNAESRKGKGREDKKFDAKQLAIDHYEKFFKYDPEYANCRFGLFAKPTEMSTGKFVKLLL